MSQKSSNRKRTLVKLVVFLPLFFCISNLAIDAWTHGNHFSLPVYLFACVIIGPFIAKL